jgi:hypothetical protein
LANWLVGQERPSEAAALLDDATTSLTSLGAAPALARAHALRASMAPAGGGATRLEPSVAK